MEVFDLISSIKEGTETDSLDELIFIMIFAVHFHKQNLHQNNLKLNIVHI
jgi:hypothetical protein